MKVTDLVIGNFYRDLCQTEIKLIYIGISNGQFPGQHDFDDAEHPGWGGCICNEKEVSLYIEPFQVTTNKT